MFMFEKIWIKNIGVQHSLGKNVQETATMFFLKKAFLVFYIVTMSIGIGLRQDLQQNRYLNSKVPFEEGLYVIYDMIQTQWEAALPYIKGVFIFCSLLLEI